MPSRRISSIRDQLATGVGPRLLPATRRQGCEGAGKIGRLDPLHGESAPAGTSGPDRYSIIASASPLPAITISPLRARSRIRRMISACAL